MTKEHPPSELHTGDLHERALAAASALRHQATGAAAPDLRHVALARRVAVGATLAALGLIAGTVLVIALVASAALPWVIGAIMAATVVGVIALGLHAGGHGLFLPLPVLALAAVWAFTVSTGNWASPFSWALAGLTFGGAVLAAALVLPIVIASRGMAGSPLGTDALQGATGVAMTALSPAGIARVNNETWTAKSLSGPLPAGAPVHVARVEGLHLLVWSEAGNVPGPEALGSTNQSKEGE
jgi:membrane-bound ClpP family serine protease